MLFRSHRLGTLLLVVSLCPPGRRFEKLECTLCLCGPTQSSDSSSELRGRVQRRQGSALVASGGQRPHPASTSRFQYSSILYTCTCLPPLQPAVIPRRPPRNVGPGIGSRPASVGWGQHWLNSMTQARNSAPLNPGRAAAKNVSQGRNARVREVAHGAHELGARADGDGMWTGRLSSLRPSRVRTIALAAVFDDTSM